MRSKDQLWTILQGPSSYAHRAGEEMKLLLLLGSSRTRRSAMHKLANHHFNVIMAVFGREERCRIIKTWLTSYQISFDVSKLSAFDQFDETHREWIFENGHRIESY